VQTGPELRRGVAELNCEGEVAGGIVVMRYGENALETIERVRERLEELKPGLPAGVEIVPVYDRGALIESAVSNLSNTLLIEIVLVTLVCAVFLLHLRSALVVVITLPVGILLAFILMRIQGINANIMSLGGIAIAIGAMVDGPIVLIENAHKRLANAAAGTAAPLTAGVGLLAAYILVCQQFVGKDTFEFGTMLSFAIPGTVIGVSYILAFNVPPIEITGTGVILVICFVFRNMPVGVRAGVAAMTQIHRDLDEASLTLGASSFGTLRRVVLPLLRPAVIAALVFSFVRAMTAISAVIFLVLLKLRHWLVWWPLAPVGFAICFASNIRDSILSVFLAWLVKFILLKVGTGAYRTGQRFFLGVLLGYTLGIVLSFIADALFYPGQGHMIHDW